LSEGTANALRGTARAARCNRRHGRDRRHGSHRRDRCHRSSRGARAAGRTGPAGRKWRTRLRGGGQQTAGRRDRQTD
jgi:hypothetical protein